MKIRSSAEIKSMDEELNLFDEEAWNFMGAVENFDTNYEYFSDIKDTQFTKKSVFMSLRSNIPLVVMVVLMSCLMTYFLTVSDVFVSGNIDYLRGIGNSFDTGVVQYVDGVDCTSEDLVEISKVLSSYVSCLRSEYDYSILYDCCLVTSTFADTYNNFTSKVKSLYDTNDCYARSLRELGGFYSILNIDKVVYDGATYHCYIDIGIPTISDINDYIYTYSYSITKQFRVMELNEANVVSCFLGITRDNPIPCSVSRVCIKFKRCSDGRLLIVDDTYFTSQCLVLYTEAITQITNILGGTLSMN